MTDEFLIQETLNTYSQAASRGDWDRVMTTFTPTAVWEIPHLKARFEGHEALRGALTHLASVMEYVLQLNTPALIKVDGDTATASSGIRECGKFTGRDVAFEFLGIYVDDLVRTADGWKFTRRVFDHIGTNNYPLLPAQPAEL
jgi:ketosteroid isomerase-like protein